MVTGASCIHCAVRGPHCFCTLSEEALLRLEKMGRRFRLTPQQQLLQEGYKPDHVYVLCGGTMKLTTSSKAGRLLLLRIAGPGDVLGLASALKDSPYEATAEALEPCEVKAIGRKEFLRFLSEFAEVGRNSASAVARDYECAVLSARRLALSASAAGKLAGVLVEWSDMSLRETAGVGAFRMPLTHEELGHMAGISRETTTRLLGRFREDGLLEIRGEWMSLPGRDQLQAMYS